MPEAPLWIVDLDRVAAAGPEASSALRRRVRSSPRIAVGRAIRWHPDLTDLAREMTFSLVGDGSAAPTEAVVVGDVEAEIARLRACVEAQPQAAVALANLLRGGGGRDPWSGFAAEAAVYSMLLAGRGFRGWLEGRPARPSAAPGGVEVEEEAGSVRVLLDRPARHNAMDTPMKEALQQVLLSLSLDADRRPIVMGGRGESFCSGGDLDEFGRGSDVVAAYMVRLERAPWRVLQEVGPRVTACVHGAAIGAGLELAAFAAVVRAAPDVVLALPAVSMGLVPGAGGTVSVPRRIGRWRAAWLMITGAPVDTDRALAWGLVDEVAR